MGDVSYIPNGHNTPAHQPMPCMGSRNLQMRAPTIFATAGGAVESLEAAHPVIHWGPPWQLRGCYQGSAAEIFTGYRAQSSR